MDDNIIKIKEINSLSIGLRLEFLYKVFDMAVHRREDAWFHHADGKQYEIVDEEKLELLGLMLKQMSENDGKFFDPDEVPAKN